MIFLHARVRNYKPYIIYSGFVVFISLLLCGALITYNNVFAETVDYNVNIEPSLVVTIPSNTVELNINPVTTQFNSADLSVTVGTNNATGYTLTMSSDSTELSKAGSADTIPTLETLAGGYPEADFTVNHWGYKLSTATNYLPFATSNELDVTNAPTNSKTSIVNFAAKADLSKPAGTYKLAIDFTAVANPLPAHTIADGGNMQDISSLAEGGCPDTLTTGQAYTLTDSRDNTSYKVARLADGKCWMLDNLRLDLGNSAVLANTTADNTNASATSLNYMKNGGGTTSDQYPTAKINNEAWTSSSQNYYSIPMTVSSGNGWDKDTTVTSYGSGSGKIGVYYNYCAASAGSYCYGNGTSSGSASGNATEDICPAGWRMPTGGSSSEYQVLYAAYSSNATNFRNALSTPLSGYFDYGSAGSQGSYGYFWSSTRSNDSNMYDLRVGSSGVGPQNVDSRFSGGSVRCLLR